MGQTAKAQQSFEKSLQSDPNRVRARIGLGLLAQENGKSEEAIRQYASAAALQPSDVVYLLLAQALKRGGRPDEAKAIYQRLASSPNFAEAQKQAALHSCGEVKPSLSSLALVFCTHVSVTGYHAERMEVSICTMRFSG